MSCEPAASDNPVLCPLERASVSKMVSSEKRAEPHKNQGFRSLKSPSQNEDGIRAFERTKAVRSAAPRPALRSYERGVAYGEKLRRKRVIAPSQTDRYLPGGWGVVR